MIAMEDEETEAFVEYQHPSPTTLQFINVTPTLEHALSTLKIRCLLQMNHQS
jgi:hypothetical protein